MYKKYLKSILTTLLISSGLVGCTTSATVLNVGELITKDNGSYVIQAHCVNSGSSLGNTAIISDSSGGSQAYLTKRCRGYGKMRVVKEGTDIRVLSFIPLKQIDSITNNTNVEVHKTPQGMISNGTNVNLNDFNNGVSYGSE